MHVENFQNITFIYIYIYVHTHIYTHIYKMYIHSMYIYTHIFVYIHVICVYMCVYICYMCVCMLYMCCISMYIKQCSQSPLRPGFTDQPRAWPPCQERSMEWQHLLHLLGMLSGSTELDKNKGQAEVIPDP